jgi:RNA polymerase sigma-70 factor (ECF subfamily)
MAVVRRELVARARGGDQAAFGELAREAADRLYAVAYRIVRDGDGAQDAVQRALIDAWRDLPQLRDPERLDAWLYRLVVRASVREATHERMQGRVRLIASDAAADDGTAGIAARDEIERALRRVPAEQRAILVLRYYLDLSLPAIGETLGLPQGTVASRLHRAVGSLRAALDAEHRLDAAWVGER